MKDLSDQLTVFLISTDEPDYQACKEALQLQDCRFRLEEIKNITPLSAAGQQMHDRCETPYFIQLDADMVLKPSAVRQMHEHIVQPIHGDDGLLVDINKVAFLAFLLRDVHLGINIYGVKIYQNAIVRNYPFRPSLSCDVDQNERLQKDGFQHILVALEAAAKQVDHPTIMGLHSPTWTPHRIFVRYKRLFQKYRTYGWDWLEPWPERFLARVSQSGREIDEWALLGAIAGLTGRFEDDTEQDNARIDEDFERLSGLFVGLDTKNDIQKP